MKMIRNLAMVIALGLLGAGCTQEQLEYQTQYRAIVPPDTLYQCPGKPPRPAGEKIMDSQVAEYLVRLDRAHSICSKSLQAIKAFAASAQLSVEKSNPPAQ